MLANIISALLAIFLIVIALYLISENRKPESTYAWLLAFIILPVVGFLLYIFAGRGWKAFGREEKLAHRALGEDFEKTLDDRVISHEEIARRLSVEKPGEVNLNLMRLVAHNAGSELTGLNEVEILQDTDEFYPRLLDDLKQAQHHIHLQYYIWSDDEFTQQVKEILIERAKAGVRVRALYDAGSSAKLSKQYKDEMRKAGIEFLPYLGFQTLHTLHLANYRSHRKITIIDGKVGYLGGMNLDKDQLPNTAWPHWRDTQVRFHGEAALALQIVFLAAWYNTTGEQLTDRSDYFPDMTDEVQTLMPVQITTSGPDSQWHGIRQLYFYLIVSARKHCYIQSPFFIPDETISEAMKAAALSGVDVRMICTERGKRMQVPYRAANTYFQDMAEAGVKIYLYTGGYYHAKSINMDSKVCTIGSCNMDVRSYNLNYEINAVIHDEEKARELEEDFMLDLEECIEFDLDEYNSRSIWSRFVDSVYRLASPLM